MDANQRRFGEPAVVLLQPQGRSRFALESLYERLVILLRRATEIFNRAFEILNLAAATSD
jgi:hypothetical protein